ncbi:MAG: ATP cone domain-containing protein [Promethearchaeia archaeon]
MEEKEKPKLQVIKATGELEDFDRKKIYKACKAAGASDEHARQVMEEIAEEVLKVPTQQIRRMAIKKLERFNLEAANKWKKYDIESEKADFGASQKI